MLIIDRFENGFAVVEDEENNQLFDIPVSSLPEGAREGSVLRRAESGYILDENYPKRADDIKSLFEKLKKRK